MCWYCLMQLATVYIAPKLLFPIHYYLVHVLHCLFPDLPQLGLYYVFLCTVSFKVPNLLLSSSALSSHSSLLFNSI